MRKTPLALLVLSIFLLGFAACGTSNSASGSGGGGSSSSAAGAATIHMGFGQFIDTSATVKAGQAVTFDDSNGSQHNLVTGNNGTFTQETGAPSEFVSGGIAFSAGQVTTITFPTAGTYMITCTIHPSMEATVTVTA
jgi:plastocyanin